MPLLKKPISAKFILLAAGSYFGGGAYIGGVNGLMEYAACDRKTIPYPKAIKTGSKIIAYGATKSFEYTAYPLFKVHSRLFSKPNTACSYQRTTKEFAVDTVANAKKKY
ncbi:MAG: hypothetical protein ACYCQI_06265 [Gammaproteobacteria bacterium]